MNPGPVIQVWGLEDNCVGNLLGTRHPAVPLKLAALCWPCKRQGAGDDDSGVLEKQQGYKVHSYSHLVQDQ